MSKSRGSAIAAGALALLLAGCGGRGDGPDGSGTIETTQVEVAPQVGGPILELPAREGRVLKKGDLVARIDPRDYELRRAEAEAGLARAQAALDLAQAGTRDEDVRRAQAEVQAAESAARAAAANRKRIEEVFARDSATAQQRDDARAAAERAEAGAEGARQVLAKAQRGSREEEIRAARATRDQAEALLHIAEKAVADCKVLAPMDGIVTTRVREVGDLAAPGAPLVTLSRPDEVWLSVYVPEARLGGVRIGQPARVKIDGNDRFFDGRVTFVSPEAEFTPKNAQTPDERAKLVYRVKITLPNPDGIFKPGMPADGYLGAAAGAAGSEANADPVAP